MADVGLGPVGGGKSVYVPPFGAVFLGAPPKGTHEQPFADVYRQRATGRATTMDVADEPVPLQERLVLLRAIGGVGPDAGTGVRGVEQTLAQLPAVVPAGVGDSRTF